MIMRCSCRSPCRHSPPGPSHWAPSRRTGPGLRQGHGVPPESTSGRARAIADCKTHEHPAPIKVHEMDIK